MIKEVKIILDPIFSLSQKGDFFELIVRDILETQRYLITSRVNFTGMEIDLLAKHKDNKQTLFVECKAKQSLESQELLTFEAKVRLKKVDFGYFISTIEFQHQVAGLIEEFEKDGRYKNLLFIGPEKILELLVDSNRIKKLDYDGKNLKIRKQILILSYLGDYYLLILGNNVNASGYVIIDANNDPARVIPSQINEMVMKEIDEVKGLKLIHSDDFKIKEVIEKKMDKVIETVAEVQESEEWFDYKPASYKHFIGRKNLRNDILDFFSEVVKKKTNRRIFYLEGKSGLGKSSIIATMRGTTRNKYYKNRYFTMAIDCRSALSNNFVADSFLKLIYSAKSKGFLKKKLQTSSLKVISNFEILSSESVIKILRMIEKQNKLLILIFDQFEDIFRKEDLFKPFYKFLNDVNDSRTNLVVGFSWKSEIIIPADHESYHLWQQAKDTTTSFVLPEFGPSEIDGVINQLERTIGQKLILELKRRLKESSQGFPWLIKKLCIHTYNQIKLGKSQEELIVQELNIEELFKTDMEGLPPKEIQALRYIAKCSYDGNIFDAKDIDEKIESKLITSLIHRRLIIVSGTKYNIYWDIFRDYLVTAKVPIIGESYLLRQTGTLCYEVFILFKDKQKLSFEEINKLHPRKLNKKTIDNILRDLKMLGLIKKLDQNGNYYVITDKNITVDDKGFRTYLIKKFEKYSPYIKLNKLSEKYNLQVLVKVLKDTFKGSKFAEKTWDVYARTLISWLKFVDEKISSRINIKEKGRPRIMVEKVKKYKQNQWPYNSPQQAIQTLAHIKNKEIETNSLNMNNIFRKKIYDLKLLGIVRGSPFSSNAKYNITNAGRKLINTENDTQQKAELAKLAMKIPKIKRGVNIYKKNPNINSNDFYNLDMNLFKEYRTESSRHYKVKMIFRWVKFIYSILYKNSN